MTRFLPQTAWASFGGKSWKYWRHAALSFPVAVFIVGAQAALAQAQAPSLPVPKTVIYPGDIIRDDMLATRHYRPGYGFNSLIVTDRSALYGRMARRTLLPGQPVLKASVREPYALLQAQTVQAIFRTEGLTITGQAVLLTSGSVGETVAARNADTGLTIRGTIQADGSLLVNAP
jgi:flagella basal body P-ring formation protein FlgA